MKAILLFGLLLLLLGGAALYYGIIGKILGKIYTPKKKEDRFE